MPENTQASELALNFRSRIQELHQKSAAIDDRIRDALTEKLETTNAAAQLVYAARQDLRPDEFNLATDFLSSDAIASYLALGRKYQDAAPEPTNDLAKSMRAVKSAMYLTGGIERPDGHGAQKLHELNFHSRAMQLAQVLASEWAKYLRRRKLEDLRTEEIDGLLAAFAPVLRVCRSLNGEIARRKQ